MANVKADDLAAAVQRELAAYSQEVTDGIKADVKRVAKECKEEIQRNAPVLTGEYRKGWRTRVAFENENDIRINIENRPTEYRLAHLLEYGHAQARGGRIPGKPHIRPAEQNAANKLMGQVKVRVRG